MKTLELSDIEDNILDYLLSCVSKMPAEIIKRFFERNEEGLKGILIKLRKGN